MTKMCVMEVRHAIWALIRDRNKLPQGYQSQNPKVKAASGHLKEAFALPLEEMMLPSQRFVEAIRQAAIALRKGTAKIREPLVIPYGEIHQFLLDCEIEFDLEILG